MKKKLTYILAIVFIAILIVALNMIATISLSGVRLDVTEENLYTLSEGSKNIAKSLEEPVTIRYFLSRTALSNYPMLREYGNQVKEMLKEYRAASDGKITIEIIDPRPDTEQEEAAMRYDLQPVPVSQSGELVYMGLVIRDESDREAVLRFLDPGKSNMLEYDISRALYGIAHHERKTIGVISSLPVMGRPAPGGMNPMMRQQGQEPWVLIEHLQSTFDVVEISPQGDAIPEEVDFLMIVHPKEVSDSIRYGIDQFIMGGGNAMVFVDPFSEADMQMQRQMSGGNPQMMMQARIDSDLPMLMRSWGLEMIKGEAGNRLPGQAGENPVVVADPTLAAQMRDQRGEIQELIAALYLSEDELNQEAIVVSDLPNMLIAAGGALRKIESDVNIEATPLLHSSQAAGLIDPLIMRFSQTAEDISDQFQATEEAYVLAYRMSGAFKSAFSDGPPEGVENADHLAQAKARSTVVVVADTDLLWDQYAYHLQNFFGRIVATPQNGNSMFAHNVAENLTGSRDLIGLRSRGMGDRPFEVIEKKLREAQAKYRETKEELDRQEREIITKLDQLQQSTSDTGVLNSALIEERKNLKRKQAETSRKLRELSRLLREDVEKLTFWLKFLNIGLMPFMVIVAGLLVAGIRIAQRKRHAANQQ